METKEIILLVVVGLLVVTAAIQTVQLAKLSNTEVSVSSSSVPTQSGHSSGSGAAPTNLEDLPSMVGGC